MSDAPDLKSPEWNKYVNEELAKKTDWYSYLPNGTRISGSPQELKRKRAEYDRQSQ